MARQRKDQLLEYFKDYPPEVKRIVNRVLVLEQQHINSLRPRVKEPIRQAIDAEVQKK